MKMDAQIANTAPLARSVAASLGRHATLTTLLLTWFAITPIASFYLRLPLDKSLITFDRTVFAIVALLLLGKYLAAQGAGVAAFFATKFEIVWALLAVAALASALTQANNTSTALRIAVDALALPLVAFHAARYHIDLRGGRRQLLFFAVVGLAILLFVTGFYEYRTGVNLFAYKGSELLRDGELRANGPFLSDSSYAIICLLVAFVLRLLPRWLHLKFDRSARLVYLCALLAAVAATLIPLFRTVAVTLIFCWALLELLLFRAARLSTAGGASPGLREMASKFLRSKRVGGYALIVVLLFAAFTAWQEVSGGNSLARRLSSPRNLYGRLATWRTAARITLENPVFGVGLANYTDYFNRKFSDWREQRDVLGDTRAVNSPHSNLLWIAAELGALGLTLYLLAYFYLLQLGIRLLKGARSARQLVAGGGFLVLIVAYTIPGLTLQSGAYWDLNLYCFFLLGLLAQKSGADDSGQGNR